MVRHRGVRRLWRRIREGLSFLSARRNRRAGTRSEAPQGALNKVAARLQGRADEATACPARGPRHMALAAVSSRAPCQCPQGHLEVKSPRHLRLRWRSSDSSDGGWNELLPCLAAREPPGRSVGVNAAAARSVWARDPDVLLSGCVACLSGQTIETLTASAPCGGSEARFAVVATR
jgi:hypothetical protein